MRLDQNLFLLINIICNSQWSTEKIHVHSNFFQGRSRHSKTTDCNLTKEEKLNSYRLKSYFFVYLLHVILKAKFLVFTIQSFYSLDWIDKKANFKHLASKSQTKSHTPLEREWTQTCFLYPKKYPRKTRGTEIPNHMHNKASMVVNGSCKKSQYK